LRVSLSHFDVHSLFWVSVPVRPWSKLRAAFASLRYASIQTITGLMRQKRIASFELGAHMKLLFRTLKAWVRGRTLFLAMLLKGQIPKGCRTCYTGREAEL